MNRSSFAALALLTSVATLLGSGCSSDDPTEPFPAAGAGQSAAGTGAMPTAGTSSGGGGGTAGTPGTAGTSSGGTSGSAGTALGGGGATGTAGAATGGGGAAGAAGAAPGGGSGGGSGMCPANISSTTPCTAAVSCPGSACGMHKLGSRSCSCAAATGMFDCGTCAYTGGEEITVKPATPLENCAMADSLMEDIVGCTQGARCKSLDTTKDRFCACWDVASTPKYDCDSTPGAWK